jgi:D-alanyl-D-alanine carboxypeptidase
MRTVDDAVCLDVRPAWWPRPAMVARAARRLVGAAAIAGLVVGLHAARGDDVRLAPGAAVGDALVGLIPRPAPAWDVGLVREPRLAYRAGKRHTIEVVRVDGAELEVGTARAFVGMRDAAAATGVALQISSGFRSHEEQRELYRAWRRRIGHRAARPGRSNHQSGRAIDFVVLNDPAARAWLEAHAGRYGFVRTVPGEPWHWEHVDAPRAAAPRAARHRRGARGKAAAKATVATRSRRSPADRPAR